MVRLIRTLSYYPIVLISGILLFVARMFGWGCLVAFLLFGGFKVAGELEVSGWVVVVMAGVGIAALILADLFTELVARLDLTGDVRMQHYFLRIDE